MELFKFKPLLKQTLWGGEKIKEFKHLQTGLEQVGESWEVSGVKDSETVVDGGTYDGCKLNELVAQLKEKLVGHENYERFGNEFPLLIKFIDARQDLSIQVHPSDETAVRQGKPRGKTEMWYLLESDEGAQLYSGLNREITPDEYKQMVDNGAIVDALARHTVSEGDVFYIPGGRIHSIGAGCFLVEIQQTSDVTYRIYDFKRRDKDGNYRELHTELAAESIDYNVHDDYCVKYTPQPDESVPLVDCPYFTTAVYDLTEPMVLDYSELDSFVILIGLKGSGKLTCAGQTVSLEAGQTVLIPATAQEVKVEGTVRFLETFV
jgi:mannose-6-phosphate isomerase